MANLVRILLVEDNPRDARLIREMLSGGAGFGATYRLAHVESLGVAEKLLSQDRFDVILLDLNLPDSGGLDTLEHLNVLNPDTAIIVLTGLSDVHLTAQAVQKGAQDYLVKDELNNQLLMRVIHYAIERKRVQEQLKWQATHDPLTGLPNRALLYDRLAQATKRSLRLKQEADTKWKAAVMLMDLDNFKVINDTLGHEMGDIVPQHVARRLETCLRQSDTVARLGGDEFVLVIEGIQSHADCEAVAQKVVRAIENPPVLQGMNGSLDGSIGISIFPDDAEDFEKLIRYAYRAMYDAKRKGVEIVFYREEAQG